MSLLISTVLSGSRNRLAPLPELPWTIPGIAGAVLAADDEHVAAVAVGNDLLLEVLRRVPAAKVGFERSAQPRPLLAQTIAQARELRAGIVDDLKAGPILRRMSPISCWNEAAVSAIAASSGNPVRTLRTAPHVASTEARNAGKVDERRRFEDASLDRKRHQQRVEVLRRLQSDLPVAQEAGRLGRCREGSRHRTRVNQRLQLRQTRRARRRLCEAAHRFDDPVVFERPQGTGVHETLEILVSVRLDRAIAEYSSVKAQGSRLQGSRKTFETTFDDFA